jgi:hypothetical protein
VGCDTVGVMTNSDKVDGKDLRSRFVFFDRPEEGPLNPNGISLSHPEEDPIFLSTREDCGSSSACYTLKDLFKEASPEMTFP